MVIGSHPHVIQPMEYHKETLNSNEFLTVYSLGNFVSNQRERRKDGGVMLRLSFKKTNSQIKIRQKDYILTWVHKYKGEDKNHYQILPCTHEKYDSTYFKHSFDFASMTTFIDDSRKQLNNNNLEIQEGSPYPAIYLDPIPPERIGLSASKNKVKALKLKNRRKRFFRKRRSKR